MGRIKNTSLYVKDSLVTLEDSLIGSDQEDSGKTKNFPIGNIFETFKAALDLPFLEYKFAGGEDPNLDENSVGYFTTNSNETSPSTITTLLINKTSTGGFNIEGLMSIISSNLTKFKLKLREATSVGEIVYYDITNVIDSIEYYTVTISNFIGDSELSDGSTYSLSFELFSSVDLSDYVLTGDLAVVATSGDYNDLINTPDEVSTTGLEAIDEGNGVGLRVTGRDPNRFLNIGLGGVDVSSNNTSPITQSGANGDYSTVSGGVNNRSTGDNSTIGGGKDNSSLANNSTVSGGENNSSGGSNSTVGGGFGNNASQPSSTVSGGFGNTSSAQSSFVGGGNNNTSSGNSSSTLGGESNSSLGDYSSSIGGQGNNAESLGEVVGGLFGTNYTGSQNSFMSTDRIVNIGNGVSDMSRSDALTILKNGLTILPSVTNSLIDGNVKSVVTKEYTDANYLSESEGDWTPLLTTSSGNDYTYSNNSSRYYKVGKKVTVNVNVNSITDGASVSGVFRISLPFPASSGPNGSIQTSTMRIARGASVNFYTSTAIVSGSLLVFSINGTALSTQLSNVSFTASGTQAALDVTVEYITD